MTLYPATLLHSLIASMILLIFLDLLSMQSCHPWRQFYLFLLLFIPLLCCHACSEIGEKHSIFHHYDVSWVFFIFIYMPFTKSRKLSSISSMLRVFIINGCLILLFLHLLWWSHKVCLYTCYSTRVWITYVIFHRCSEELRKRTKVPARFSKWPPDPSAMHSFVSHEPHLSPTVNLWTLLAVVIFSFSFISLYNSTDVSYHGGKHGTWGAPLCLYLLNFLQWPRIACVKRKFFNFLCN